MATVSTASTYATMASRLAVPRPVPLPRTSTGLVYQPKSGLVQGSIPGGVLVAIPIPGSTVEEAPPEESLGDKIMNWWSRMPLSQKAMTVGGVAAVGYGVYWLATRKKSATPNRRRGTVKHRGTVRKRRLARYKAYGTTYGPGGSIASIPPGKKLYRPRFSRKRV